MEVEGASRRLLGASDKEDAAVSHLADCYVLALTCRKKAKAEVTAHPITEAVAVNGIRHELKGPPLLVKQVVVCRCATACHQGAAASSGKELQLPRLSTATTPLRATPSQLHTR